MEKIRSGMPLNVGLDSAILMNPRPGLHRSCRQLFRPLMDCKSCKTRHRADKLIEDAGTNPAGWDFARMKEFIDNEGINCPNCGGHNFTDIRTFNLMFKTFRASPRTQKRIIPSSRNRSGYFCEFQQHPAQLAQEDSFGVAQIGKSFRNEITP